MWPGGQNVAGLSFCIAYGGGIEMDRGSRESDLLPCTLAQFHAPCLQAIGNFFRHVVFIVFG